MERRAGEQLSCLPCQLLPFDGRRDHHVDQRGGRLALSQTLSAGRGLAAAFAFFTVDRVPRWGLPRQLANLLALGTMGLLYFEYKTDDSQMIRSLGHWLVYLQLIKFFLPKTAVDDWS